MLQSPADYNLAGVDAFSAGLAGFQMGQQGRATEQGMVGEAQRQDVFGQDATQRQAMNAQNMAQSATQFGQQNTLFDQGQQDRAAQEAQARAFMADQVALADKVETGQVTAKDFTAFTVKYPEFADEMKASFADLSTDRRRTDAFELAKAATALKSGKPEVAIQMLEDRAIAAENANLKDEADMARALKAQIEMDPVAGLTLAGLALQQLDEPSFKAVFGDAGLAGRKVQSSTDIGSGTTVTVFTDGSKEVQDATGAVLTGEAATAAVKAAEDRAVDLKREGAAGVAEGRLTTTIELGGEAKAAEEAGKLAIAKSGEAFDALGKINSNILNIDRAIAAIDAGARTGAIDQYLPNISAASLDLANTMNRLGLDVVSSVTFGALSEGEMKLAMQTAVPSGMDEPSLRKWLVDKKAAQEKASKAMYNAAVYLGEPGHTLVDWLKENPQGAAQVPPNVQSLLDAAGLTADDWSGLTPEQQAEFLE